MIAVSNKGKTYVHFLVLENSKEETTITVAFTEESIQEINWTFVLMSGHLPVIKPTPWLLPVNSTEIYFTPGFWACNCKGDDWLHFHHSTNCPACGAGVIDFVRNPNPTLKSTMQLWGKGPFPSIEEAIASTLLKIPFVKGSMLPLLQHLKFFNYDPMLAFNKRNML